MEDSPLHFCNKCSKSFNHKIKLAVHKKYQHKTKDSLDCKNDAITYDFYPKDAPLWKFSKDDNNDTKLKMASNLTQISEIESSKKLQMAESRETHQNIYTTSQVSQQCLNIVASTKASCNSKLKSAQESQAEHNQEHYIISHGHDNSCIGSEDEKFHENSGEPKQNFRVNLTEKLENQDPLKTNSIRKPLRRKSFDFLQKKHDEQKQLRQIHSRRNSQMKKRKRNNESDKVSGLHKKIPRSADCASLVPAGKDLNTGSNQIALPSSALASKSQIDSTKKRQSTLQKNQHEGILSKVKPHKCSYCDYSSTNAGSVKRHEKFHTGEKPYKCRCCDYSSTQLGDLKKHERIHTGERPYKCRYCNHSSTQSSAIKSHERIHTRETPYKCRFCDHSATRAGDLKKHEKIHTREIRYKCPYCDYSASDASSIKNHEKIHAGEKPYKCCYCDHRSTQASDMQKHERIHTRERPYKCDNCDFTTNKQSILARHLRTHTEEKPYECASCDYKGKTHSAMMLHLRIHM